ncbi:MAG TPA: lytic transglycosylase domain-containing protein [Verrucomicrobiae bacterium]|nr:lytic transglycosylase domain-containing protein [Verrucomicrobiae bacterium]
MNRRWPFFLLLLALLCGLIGYWRYYEWRDHSQDAPILAAARRYGVEPALVKAVVWRESRFNPEVRGSRGEIGLMQVLPDAAAKDWADAERLKILPPEHLFNPVTNTLAGAWYLSKLLKRYGQTDNPLPYVLADYNAGRSNVLKWKKGAAATNSVAFLQQITFPGTKGYVQSVMRRYAHYRPIFPAAESKMSANQ